MYWAMLLTGETVSDRIVTWSPLVPEAAMSCFALARSGPCQTPSEVFPEVYGQYGGDPPGMAAGTIWQVGVATPEPPHSVTTALRSTAKFTACRACRLLNGGISVFSVNQYVPSDGSTLIWFGYVDTNVAIRSPGGLS